MTHANRNKATNRSHQRKRARVSKRAETPRRHMHHDKHNDNLQANPHYLDTHAHANDRMTDIKTFTKMCWPDAHPAFVRVRVSKIRWFVYRLLRFVIVVLLVSSLFLFCSWLMLFSSDSCGCICLLAVLEEFSLVGVVEHAQFSLSSILPPPGFCQDLDFQAERCPCLH
jgi:hypothetical protein